MKKFKNIIIEGYQPKNWINNPMNPNYVAITAGDDTFGRVKSGSSKTLKDINTI